MDLDLFRTLSKYPFIYDGTLHDSVELRQNKTCLEKCKQRDCLTLLSDGAHLSEYVCSKDYNNVLLIVGELRFLLNGLIYSSNKTIPNGRKDVRKEWVVDKHAVLLFANKIIEIENHLNNRVNETFEKNFSMFHDFKTSMSIFFSCTQAIISDLPGETFEEKLDNGDKPIKDLFNALELITSQLGMIDVIINPKSITFGSKKLISIYKLFHKISILFQHLSETKHVKIELINIDGAFIDSSLCYESIEFIPLILLDNAIKYSAENTTIKIEITQTYYSAIVKVKSIGPFVREENQTKIFEKFFRDESAQIFSKQGIGMGLWIAQQILQAHGSKLYYFKDKYATGDIGLNIFEFSLPTIDKFDYSKYRS